jgi:hypothetical protein
MIKRTIFIIFQIAVFLLATEAQEKKTDQDLRREVTLYNPYKPSLADAKKKNYLPEINDTARVNPVFSYEVVSKPFTPVYSISPIKSASLLSDPLPRLYKSYLKIGIGNNNTPMGELSISNHRSKKGAVGFYARHYSSNGKVPLENKQRVYAGFMDNDGSLYGKRFFRKSYIDLSANFLQRTRYAYGYNTAVPFEFIKKNIRLDCYNGGIAASFSSLNLDSADLSFDFGLSYDFFHNTKERTMNHIGFHGSLSGLYQGFYAGSEIKIDHYRLSESLDLEPKYILSLNPYVRKSTEQWNFNVGIRLSAERNLENKTKVYFHPDVRFGFTIVPEYLSFFAGLAGKLENNEPLRIISENPYLVPDGSLFRIPNTNHSLIISGGLKGNNGLGGNYLASASYSLINNLLLYSNVVYPDTVGSVERGNHFIVVPDEGEVFNIHGEFTGSITKRLSFNTSANYYKYTLSANPHAWNKPDWDGKIGLNYNLRNKIIAGIDVTALGSRKLMVSQSPTGWMTLIPSVSEKPVHLNLGFSAEYRYTKILSFWFRINNVSWDRYYEWAYYPSQMFNFMFGFSYSL